MFTINYMLFSYRLPYQGYDIIKAVLPPDLEEAYSHIKFHYEFASEDEKIKQYWLCMFGGNYRYLSKSRLAFNAWYYNEKYISVNSVLDYYGAYYGNLDYYFR